MSWPTSKEHPFRAFGQLYCRCIVGVRPGLRMGLGNEERRNPQAGHPPDRHSPRLLRHLQAPLDEEDPDGTQGLP